MGNYYIEFTDHPELDDPIAFAASSSPDTLYYHQAMKAQDRQQFKDSMQTEIDAHIQEGTLVVVPRKSVPKGKTILPSVWSMKRKRRIQTNEIYKHKSRLNLHGGKQVKGEHFTESFAAVVQWTSIRLMLIVSYETD